MKNVIYLAIPEIINSHKGNTVNICLKKYVTAKLISLYLICL